MPEEIKDIQSQVNNQNQTSTYRSIFKATSLFGGVQFYQIIIGILRSKFIAMIIGPAGMGIAGLYQSATSLISSLTSMGLSNSAVRDVSEANATSDQNRINYTMSSLRILVWLTGLLGLFIVMVGAPLLSFSTFGDYTYTIPFILLSVTLLVDQLTVGKKAILQGTRRLKDLAKSSAIGSTLGLIITIPLYYLWGIDGIVPTLIIMSFVSFFLAHFYARKVPFQKVKMTLKEAVHNGSVMIKMGIAMSLNGLLVTGASYVLRIFIMNRGGTAEVGLFTAGFAIVTTYVGMVFTAINTDYYPRLAAINHDNKQCGELMNKEGEIGSLILAPCLVFCIVFMPLIIRILYTEEFDSATDYVLWACLGMLFKFVSWVVAMIFIAKGDMKLFLINETTCMVYQLFLNILGYYLDGLRGLGIAFTLGYILYAIQVVFVAKIRYKYIISPDFAKLFLVMLALITATLLCMVSMSGVMSWITGGTLLLVTCGYALVGLNKKMDLIKALNANNLWKKK